VEYEGGEPVEYVPVRRGALDGVPIEQGGEGKADTQPERNASGRRGAGEAWRAGRARVVHCPAKEGMV